MTTIAYNTSKGAVVNFTRALGCEWGAYNITVNAICPGFFPSKMTMGTLKAMGEEKLAAHAPLAVANALTRPWPGESWQPLYVAAALENVALLALLTLAAWAAVRGRPGRLPFSLTLGLVVFCLVLAFLIGITTPNLGSLNRYRSGLLPYLLLLLFQNDYAAAAFRRLGLGRWPQH